MSGHNFTIGVVLAAFIFAASAPAAKQQKRTEPREPLPSEIMPLADQAILNGIDRAGDAFIAVGARGIVLRSPDGEHWQQIKVPTRATLTQVVFYNDQIGWAVGWDGVVLRTTDAGKTWKLVNFQSKWGKAFFDILPTGPKSAIVVGANGRVIRTADAGQTWTRLENEAFREALNLFDIERIGESGIVIAGERGINLRSLDGGKTWHMLQPPYNGSFFGVLPVGKHGALFYGLEAEVYYAPDIRKLPTHPNPAKYSAFTAKQITDPEKLAAMGWRRIKTPFNESLFGGLIREDGRLVLVGVHGNILYGSVNSDTLKAVHDRVTSAALSDIVVTDEGWLLTGGGGLYHMQPAWE